MECESSLVYYLFVVLLLGSGVPDMGGELCLLEKKQRKSGLDLGAISVRPDRRRAAVGRR